MPLAPTPPPLLLKDGRLKVPLAGAFSQSEPTVALSVSSPPSPLSPPPLSLARPLALSGDHQLLVRMHTSRADDKWCAKRLNQ